MTPQTSVPAAQVGKLNRRVAGAKSHGGIRPGHVWNRRPNVALATGHVTNPTRHVGNAAPHVANGNRHVGLAKPPV